MPTQVYGLVDKSAGTGMHLPVKLYGSSAEAARAAKERERHEAPAVVDAYFRHTAADVVVSLHRVDALENG